MQNGLQVYKTLLSEYATYAANPRPLPARYYSHSQEHHNMAQVLLGGHGLARFPAIHHPTGVEIAVLVQ